MSMCRCLSCHNRQSSQYKAKGQTACERLECGESATREKCEARAGFSAAAAQLTHLCSER